MSRLIVEAVTDRNPNITEGMIVGVESVVSVSQQDGKPVRSLDRSNFVVTRLAPQDFAELEVMTCSADVDGFYRLRIAPAGHSQWNNGGYVCALTVSQTRPASGPVGKPHTDRGQTVFRIDIGAKAPASDVQSAVQEEMAGTTA